ncbi:MAG: outer membrane beta-barrel protein [Flavobacterium sp.]|nr:outer membrane beta-barrel protein [Flavobacterium sp.]
MKTTFSIVLFCFFMHTNAQFDAIVNPKEKWFFGIEIGHNTITSFESGGSKNGIQGGILAEYYFARHWSVTGRFKYFETGVSFDYGNNVFNGAVIAIPVNIKWEYRIVNNFRGNFKLGYALNYEIKSEYDYPEDASTNFSKNYGTLNTGLGFNYFINQKTAFYIEYEVFVLGNDRGNSDFLQFVPNSPNNNLLNLGVKYHF